MLAQIDGATPADLDLHLIADNSSAHRIQVMHDFLAAHHRLHLHFAPTGASWLNAVETWFGQLELRRGVFTSVSRLRDEIRHFIRLTVHGGPCHSPLVWPKERAGPRCSRAPWT